MITSHFLNLTGTSKKDPDAYLCQRFIFFIKKIIKRKQKCPYVCWEFILIGFARYHLNTSRSLISKLLKIIVQKSCSPSGKQTKSKDWIVDFMFVSSKHFFILKVFKFQHLRLCWLSRLRYIWDKPGMSTHSWYLNSDDI